MTDQTPCGICILGSTGSVGQNTLEVIKKHPDKFTVIALSAQQSAVKLFEQCYEFRPAFAVLEQAAQAAALQDQLKMHGVATKVLVGKSGLCAIAQLPTVKKVVAAIVGAAGLAPIMSAIEVGKQVLIANKEPLVMAGDLLIAKAHQRGAILLPIDSEHNALFQCMPANYVTGTRPQNVARLTLTASGGPFLHHSQAQMTDITPEMACRHPNWLMGKKITVDCATLMNKGLEVIEASKLFQFSAAEIDVVIHPQSIVHSLVEYIDGSLLAQLGAPDMRIPISHTLAWPNRCTSGAARLSLTEIGQLTFLEPDNNKFPCLPLAFEALKLGGAACAILNASNEVAVQAFLNRRMRFSEIPIMIEKVLHKFWNLPATTLEEILGADQVARLYTENLIRTRSMTPALV